MKNFYKLFIITILLIGTVCPVYATIGRMAPASRYSFNNTRFCPQRSVYVNRFQPIRNRNNYIYSQQQARYNGYRTGIYGNGYNNTYYYNRYRR